MQFLFLVFSFVVALAGQVLAFDIPDPHNKITYTTQNILNLPDGPVTQACAANLTLARNMINGCNDNTACLCGTDVVWALVDSQTCMLHFLIDRNLPSPDLKVGSNIIVSGYAAQCAALANVTLPPELSALTLPEKWDGPFVAVLPVGGAVVVVIIGALLGGSALFLLSNLD
ncbi:hypothetical protein CC1G_09724 [Coprinopsis cinerea okayama7|uniref:Extracellular membrane protein CFEM domain-containing protein n=1 Tax=Coprinopsis cinerea (strain Okayama-7 / 130 / ATCC MYA-4618 / FGSC 9003) TaxID=240176 RepID=A8NJH1_COPC7|nr:hypothetical protein CC1G_09724 [Coprinopsis cinerea okayama7\|eukprot:XP_001834224.1 hypothetical protein CC1G_09724 [Coprinopsis cinerea okayama7\